MVIIVLQVLCACTVAYVLSLSLALSLTSIASHQCDHTHQSFAQVQPAPCLTTETACRFYRPVATHRRGKDVASGSIKRAGEPRNESRQSMQMKTVFTEQESTVQPVDIKARLGPEKNENDSYFKSSHYESKIAATKSRSTSEQLKTRGDTPGAFGLSSVVLSQILSRKLALQHPCPSTSPLNSLTTGGIQTDFILSNFSGRMINSDWYRSHTNGSYICVAWKQIIKSNACKIPRKGTLQGGYRSFFKGYKRSRHCGIVVKSGGIWEKWFY